jgi:putative ABC transport system permease protein
MQTLLADLRFAFRMLAKRPGFTTVAILALALGIGANTAVFSVLRAVVLRPLPYADPSQLVAVWESNAKDSQRREPSSPPNLKDWSERNHSFTSMAGYTLGWSALTDSGDPEMFDAAFVTMNYFELLSVKPALGRIISSSDPENVVLMSYELWEHRFGHDPKIIGSQLRLGGTLRTVLGVMPPLFHDADFMFRSPARLWMPLSASDLRQARRSDFLRVIGRMKPGVKVAQARAELIGIAAQLKQEYPGANSAWNLELHPLDEAISAETSRSLWLLLASAAVLLLIACANVANLSLARSAERAREFAVRAALGGGAVRLFRQLITESLVLGLLGGSAGFVLGNWAMHAMLALGGAYIPRSNEVRLDSWVILFALGACCLTAVLFGTLPARQAARADLNDALKSSSRAATSGRKRSRAVLVVAEVALSLVLAVSAGLLLRSFQRIQGVELGFEPSRLLTAGLRLPGDRARGVQFLSEFLQRVERLPGVLSAAASAGAPMTSAGHNAFLIEGRPKPGFDTTQDAILDPVTPGYFRTMEIALRSGRYLNDEDSPESPHAVIAESFARRYFPNEDPIGHGISFDGKNYWPIAGVVADVHQQGLGMAPKPQLYVSHRQFRNMQVVLVIRTTAEPRSMLSAIRGELRAMDPARPLFDIRTEEELISANVAPRRFALTLAGLFAGLALIIAAIGIYGVISYTVTESTKEIGIRMALGALKSDVLRIVFTRGIKLVVIGIVAGTAASLAVTRVMTSFLFNVSASDPVTFLCVAGIFIMVALAACLIPAHRATNVDPMVALHYE